MKTQTIERQLATLAKARYPIIACLSHEEVRVRDAIAEIAVAQEKRLLIWKQTTGVLEQEPATGETSPLAEFKKSEQTILFLRQLLEWGQPTPQQKQGEKAIVVAHDIHPFLGESAVRRLLRDVAEQFRVQHKTLILVSPTIDLPVELEKSVTVLDWPLPDEATIEEAVKDFIADIEENEKVTVDVDEDLRGLYVRNLKGLPLLSVRQLLGRAAVADRVLNQDTLAYIIEEKKAIIAASGVMEYIGEQETTDNIGGLDNLKSYMEEVRATFSPRAEAAGVSVPKGLIMVGIPGCGKSLSARAVAGGQMPLVRIDFGRLFGSRLGASEANLAMVFKTLRAVAPVVAWIDEGEKQLAVGSGQTDGGTSLRMFGSLLTFLEENTAPVFFVMTANNMDLLAQNPELLERFDETFFVDLPVLEERQDILAIHLRKAGLEPADFPLEELAGTTDGYSGRMLARAVERGIRRAFADGERPVSGEDLKAVLSVMKPLSETQGGRIDDMREAANQYLPASSKKQTVAGVGAKMAAIEM